MAILACLAACGEAGDGAGDGTDTGEVGQTTGSDTGSDTGSASAAASADSTSSTSSPDVCDDDGGDFGDETSGGGAEGTEAGMGGDIPIGITVYALREDGLEPGLLVEIEDLVITAPVVVDGIGELVFVQGIAGGPYSGVTLAVTHATVTLPIGTRVRVIGRVTRSGDDEQILVQGDEAGIFADGEAALPEPHVIDLAALTDPDDALGPYDATLVRVETPEVVDAPPCPGEFALAADLRVDDLFLGALAPTPSAGTTYSAITGALRHTGAGFEVAPRSLDDLLE